MKRRDFLRCGATAAGAFISLDRFPHHLYASESEEDSRATSSRSGKPASRCPGSRRAPGPAASTTARTRSGRWATAASPTCWSRASTTASTSGTSPISTAATRTRRRALQTVKRDNVVILSKTHASTEKEMWADLDRFRKEMGTDHIDIVLLHCMLNANWAQEKAGAMTVLSEAKQKGIIRAHGVSCHDLGAMKVAAESDWVDVDLARLNPAGVAMDADPARSSRCCGRCAARQGRDRDEDPRRRRAQQPPRRGAPVRGRAGLPRLLHDRLPVARGARRSDDEDSGRQREGLRASRWRFA